MKKLSRKQLLTVLTTSAIVVTSAFSFAAWNQLTAKTTGTVKFEKPVTVEASALTVNQVATDSDKVGYIPSYECDATFTVAGTTGKNAELNVAATIKDGANEITDGVKVTILKKGAGDTYEAVTPNEKVIDGTQSYRIVVEVDDTKADFTNILNKDLSVELTGNLEDITP